MRTTYSDKQLIDGIKTQDKEVLVYIYKKYRPMVIGYVTKNSGTEKEAEDVLHDTFINIYKSVRKPDFYLKKNFTVYFSTICKNTWKYALKMKNRCIQSDIFFDEPDTHDTDMYNEYKQEHLHKIIIEKFLLLDEKCQYILKLYYFGKMRMKEIANTIGYKNDKMAIKKKYKCLENLKVLIKGNLTNNNSQYHE